MKKTGYTLPVGVYEASDIELMLRSLLSKDVKLSIAIDNIRLKSHVKNTQTLLFTYKSFSFMSCWGLPNLVEGP